MQRNHDVVCEVMESMESLKRYHALTTPLIPLLPGICLSDNVHTRGILESPAHSPIKLYTMIRENR